MQSNGVFSWILYSARLLVENGKNANVLGP